MVYYRKYRPQTIADLDNKELREKLYSLFKTSDYAHSFLFTGPKGLGKTSTARIIAKVINCTHDAIDHPERLNTNEGVEGSPKEIASSQAPRNDEVFDVSKIEPDNVCDQCIAITNGSSVDVLEIDGASNRGIDEIRDLRDRVKLAPSSAKKKVYIIDEVHMLTTEAFNALLKTIEEPPSHVMFIFCTTEPHKVPATIISRCMHISLHTATTEELVHAFQRIVVGEKLDIEEGVLEEIAHFADGGFRDGVKILEEIVGLSDGQKITKELVEKTYHVSGSISFVTELLTKLQSKKTKEAVDIIQELQVQNIDLKYFLTQLLETLHVLLLEKVGIPQDTLSKEIKALAYTKEEIQTLLILFSECVKELKFAIIPQLPLEMAVIEYCNLSLEKILNQVLPAGRQVQDDIKVVPQDDSQKHTINTMLRKQQNDKIQVILGKAPVQPVKTEAPKPQVQQGNINDMVSLMENIIYKVKPLNHSLAGVLRGCKVKSVTDTALVMEAAYKFHKEKLEERASCEIIEKTIREITGKPLSLQVVLK